ncbi:J domain-containing protein [Methylocystis bryophila]|uniref:J domain-containing protein n=1 Tax=Methylocystis bryophila TaxID=655015 RepID=A0A1W6MYZ0_9HYPH|nr:hypothetical protein [Methylocystis bryophila]ARN82773.1 hypothetical protein B1812_18640 [Methylocystis bryophila]
MRRPTIRFHLFDSGRGRLALGPSSRGVGLPLTAASLALGLAVLAPFLFVLLSARRELAALAVDPAHAASLLELHKSPFHEAAAAGGRSVLAAAFLAQTRIAALGFCAIGAYFAWRGYANHRPRAWGPFFWVSALCLFFIAPVLLPKLSAQRADYAVTAVVGAAHGVAKPRQQAVAVLPLKLDPTTVLATRAGLAAFAAAFLSLACHDAAFRLREVLIDLGLAEPEPQKPGSGGAENEGVEEKLRRAKRKPQEPRREGEESRPGRRTRARKAGTPEDPRIRAFAMLGLPSGASRAEIEKAFRARIKRAHPDHGGSAEQAAALNEARNLLLTHG